MANYTDIIITNSTRIPSQQYGQREAAWKVADPQQVAVPQLPLEEEQDAGHAVNSVRGWGRGRYDAWRRRQDSG